MLSVWCQMFSVEGSGFMVHGAGFVRFPHLGGMQLVDELEGAFEGQVRLEIKTKSSK